MAQKDLIFIDEDNTGDFSIYLSPSDVKRIIMSLSKLSGEDCWIKFYTEGTKTYIWDKRKIRGDTYISRKEFHKLLAQAVKDND